MEKKEENLYELFQKYSYTELKQLFKEAKTKDGKLNWRRKFIPVWAKEFI